MKFTNAIIFALPAVLLAAALPDTETQVTKYCTGGNYEACVADKFCVLSYPAGCECENQVKTTCASACAAGAPKLSECAPVEPKMMMKRSTDVALESSQNEGITCYQNCLSQRACIQSWPQSCFCANDNKRNCASSCRVPALDLQKCE